MGHKLEAGHPLNSSTTPHRHIEADKLAHDTALNSPSSWQPEREAVAEALRLGTVVAMTDLYQHGISFRSMASNLSLTPPLRAAILARY